MNAIQRGTATPGILKRRNRVKRDAESHLRGGQKSPYNINGQTGNSDDREVYCPSATIQKKLPTIAPDGAWTREGGVV